MKTVQEKIYTYDREYVNIEKLALGKKSSKRSTDSFIHPVNKEGIKRTRRRAFPPTFHLCEYKEI